MDWKGLFKPHILERGLDYYELGYVEDYLAEGDFVQATVQGSSAYDVYIDIADGEIIDMECQCPYAQEGNNCKHMAAVLFCMDEEAGKGSVSKKSPSGNDLKSSVKRLVQEADETAVRVFLTEVLEKDEKLLGRFKSSLCCEISPEDMKRYKNQIDRICSKYAGRQGFIDYYNAWPFISELEEFLNRDIGRILKNQQYKEAFELTNYVFVMAGNQDMDDSDGGTGMLADRCMKIWKEILDRGDLCLKRSMFQWFKEHMNGQVIDYMEENIEEILFDDFSENEFLKDKLVFTEKKVCKYRKEPDSWSRGYYAGKWAIRHIEIMRELNMPEESINEYVLGNLEFNTVRKYYIQDCMNKKRYDAAIQALEDGKKADRNSPGLAADYSLQLKELYKLTGRAKDYEKELWLLMLQYKAGDVAVYKELKTLYTEEEWVQKRETIFEKMLPYKDVSKLYQEDQLYDRLLELVLNSSGLGKLTEYETCLKKIYPEELLRKYETVVNSMAVHTSDRKHYRELVAILKRMQKYPGGNTRVDKIADNWRQTYKNRRAMMDELKEIPYSEKDKA